jgi:hypothetical protein
MTNDIVLQEIKYFGTYENTLVDNAHLQHPTEAELAQSSNAELIERRRDAINALAQLAIGPESDI